MLLPGVSLASLGYPRGFFATDFSEYATGVQPGDWTKLGSTVTGTWTVSANNSAISGRLLTGLGTGTSPDAGLSFNRCGTAVTDGDVLALVLTGNLTTGTVSNPDILMRGSTTADKAYAARIDFNTAQTLSIFNINNGILATTAFTWAANSLYWIRMHITGTTISAKAWNYGSAENNATLLSTTNASYASGYVGVGVVAAGFNGQGSIEWFSFANGASAAPYPSG